MKFAFPAALILAVTVTGCASTAVPEVVDDTNNVTIADLDNAWYQAAQNDLHDARARMPGKTRARNVILFIGDGMSLATVTAARILEGQLRGESGEENLLSFERFPVTGLAKTYNTNSQVPDSAGTATAMLSGVKTQISVLGVDENVRFRDCSSVADSSVPTLLEHAERHGLATGIVTTTRITHATPASAYAHVASRSWEADVGEQIQPCTDIATQLVEFDIGDGPEVILGGGRLAFFPETEADFEDNTAIGWRKDGRNLIREWLQRNNGAEFVWNLEQFEKAAISRTGPLLGLFEPYDMQYEADRDRGPQGEPSLAQMVEKAVRVLRQSDEGFFLLVEGGRIDHAHHQGNAYRALHDTLALADAVEIARELTSSDDTLIVVTADHGHVMEIAGYPRRGNPILGKVVSPLAEHEDQYSTDALGLPYTTLVYGNGPGHIAASDSQLAGVKSYPHQLEKYIESPATRPDLSDVDTGAAGYIQEAAVPMRSETHSGTDVPVYADGPGAWLLTGVREQHYLFHVMLHALFGT
ncbi:MAG: alkaline phosphatase [Gammaproteobacteria bacterium]|nr:alkaline phosphatase [Gammaproteobacteria bacterium]NND58990.1 alkaline phosphatase [Gammaproteobacteria bacterium]